MLPVMSISMATYDALDTSMWKHCWITVKEQHEDALNTLLDAVTKGSQFLAIPVGEIVLSGLSEGQILQLIEGRDDLIYRGDFDSVYVLQGLWYAVEEAVTKIAPNAIHQRLIAVKLSFSDPHMIEKLRTELGSNPSLNYTEIEGAED